MTRIEEFLPSGSAAATHSPCQPRAPHQNIYTYIGASALASTTKQHISYKTKPP